MDNGRDGSRLAEERAARWTVILECGGYVRRQLIQSNSLPETVRRPEFTHTQLSDLRTPLVLDDHTGFAGALFRPAQVV